MMSLKIVAKRLGVSEKTVRVFVANRELACYKVGRSVRISERDLEIFLKARRCPARGERIALPDLVRIADK